MANVEFGVMYPEHEVSPQLYLKFAGLAEDLGFSYLACGEHVLFHDHPTPNSLIALSVVAGVTSRIELLSSVTLLPLYPAVLAAKMASTLHVLSGGRFNLGVGVGGEYPKEFEACGVGTGDRGQRTNEALYIVRRLLSGEALEFYGKFNEFSKIAINPTVQPAPSIWVAGRKEAAIRRAARYGDVWMPYLYTPEQLRTSVEKIRRYESKYGREQRITAAALITLSVDNDGSKAERVVVDTISRFYHQDFSGPLRKYLIAGTPDYCRRRLKEYAEAGAERMILRLVAEPDTSFRMVRLIAEEVVPEFS